MPRGLALALACSIAAHLAAICSYAPATREVAPRTTPKLTLRAARSTAVVATTTTIPVALPSAPPVATAVESIAPPRSALASLTPREPADIAPPAEPAIVSTAEMPGVALMRGVASPFGGLRRVAANELAVHASAHAYEQHRAASLQAQMRAHLASMAPNECEATRASPCPNE